MKSIKILATACIYASALAMVGCASAPSKKENKVFEQHKPKSILVLPPINNSPDVRGTYGYLSTTSEPIAEAGYYVFPVALVDQTFKQNGITVAAEMHKVSAKKLREIFGADAVMYIKLDEYGSKYNVISSRVEVSASAKLVDLHTGKVLWTGYERVVDAESSNNGIVGTLLSAAVNQVFNSYNDRAHKVSKKVNHQLFAPKYSDGLMPGHRMPKKEAQK